MWRAATAVMLVVSFLISCCACYRASVTEDNWLLGDTSTQAKKKRDFLRFSQWLRDLSPTRNKLVRVRYSELHGGGLFLASQEELSIRVGDLILEVPIAATISEEQVLLHSPYREIIRNRVANELFVILSVAMEIGLGEKSAFAEWVAAFPLRSEIIPPYMWPKHIIAAIEPNSARDLCRSRREVHLGEFDEQAELIRELNSYLNKAGGTGPRIGWETFVYAKSLVETRAWVINGSYFLVPGVDHVNFGHGGTQEAQFDQTKLGLPMTRDHPKFLDHVHKIDRSPTRHDFIQVMADRPYTLGRRVGPVEVFQSYGQQRSDVLLAHYGFVPEENVYDCQPVDLRIGAPPMWRRGLVYQRLHGVMERAASVCVHRPSVQEKTSVPLLTFVSMVYAADQLLENQVAEVIGECLAQAARAMYAIDDVIRHPHFQAKTASDLALNCFVDRNISDLADDAVLLHTLMEREKEIAARIIAENIRTQFSRHNTRVASVRSDLSHAVGDGGVDGRRALEQIDPRLEMVERLAQQRESLLRGVLLGLERRDLQHTLEKDELDYPHWFWEWSPPRRPPQKLRPVDELVAVE